MLQEGSGKSPGTLWRGQLAVAREEYWREVMPPNRRSRGENIVEVSAIKCRLRLRVTGLQREARDLNQVVATAMD